MRIPLKKGMFLVAAPSLADPNFARSVVLICEHSKDGTMGLIVNRPTKIELASILPEDLVPPDRKAIAFQGGPVQPDHVLILHGHAGDALDVHPILDGIFLGGSPEAFKKAFAAEAWGKVPIRCYLGYAGWGAGQLAEEMKEGAWIPKPAKAADVFAADPSGLWETLIGKQARDPFAPPEGPELN